MRNFLHRLALGLIGPIRPIGPITFDRIACIELSRMGDVMAMLPAINALRSRHPSSYFAVAVRHEYAELLRRAHVADEVLGVRRRNIVRRLRERKITLACSMSPSTTNAMAALFGSKQSVGYLSTPKSLPGISETSVVSAIGAEIMPRSVHHMNIYLRAMEVCQTLGIGEEFRLETISIDQEWERISRPGLRSLDSIVQSPYIVLHPFSGWKFRSWPAERWRRLVELIIGKTKLGCVCISSKAEEASLRRIVDPGSRIGIATGLSLVDLAVLIKKSRVFVGNDSGPLHLAAAIGVPVVGLYGPASPSYTAPPAGQGHYLFHQMECSPCPQRRCIRPNDTCMMQIDHESVFEAIERATGKNVA